MPEGSSSHDPAVTVAVLGMLLIIVIEVIKIRDAQRAANPPAG